MRGADLSIFSSLNESIKRKGNDLPCMHHMFIKIQQNLIFSMIQSNILSLICYHHSVFYIILYYHRFSFVVVMAIVYKGRKRPFWTFQMFMIVARACVWTHWNTRVSECYIHQSLRAFFPSSINFFLTQRLNYRDTKNISVENIHTVYAKVIVYWV